MENFIKQYIHQSPNGFITYADFIEKVLYHPVLGYYMKETVKIGKDGDFYTTSNIANVYGKTVAKWYSKLVLELGLPANICELGGGTGRFAKAFIDEWELLTSVPLTYTIIETSPYHRKIQQKMISHKVNRLESVKELTSFAGLIFSNELFDALPVHVIRRVDNELFEIMVTVNKDKLVEKMLPLKDERILDFIATQKLSLQEGQRIEIPLAMIELVESIAKALSHGLIMTVDYGYTNDEWRQPSRKSGSLRGYYKHDMISDVLLYPGKMDITSHVHFDALVDIGEKYGLSFIQKLRQDEFFLATGILEELQENFDPNPFSEKSKQNRAIRSLIMPSGLSTYFHAIIQEKGLGEKVSKIFS